MLYVCNYLRGYLCDCGLGFLFGEKKRRKEFMDIMNGLHFASSYFEIDSLAFTQKVFN